ncbi:predicted protein [Fibroporia radiculosa]|uniref:Uncharacterized protein n=1 Tax=Fibroporia radiculosa TaxID=599839 RepID=J7S640_9APHY|nr:predicted protein [Fibroporia radiculosa]
MVGPLLVYVLLQALPCLRSKFMDTAD